jgi:DNA-binding NtrC family response regulator
MVNILCVEDHYGMARLIQLILERDEHAFNVYHVTYFSDALDTLTNEKIDLVLLDLNLPDSQGIDSLTRIKSKYPDMPVVVMTGLGDHEINKEVIEHGATHFLIKGDFDAKYLSEIIRGALRTE